MILKRKNYKVLLNASAEKNYYTKFHRECQAFDIIYTKFQRENNS